MPFKKGQSGNGGVGRKPGAKNKLRKSDELWKEFGERVMTKGLDKYETWLFGKSISPDRFASEFVWLMEFFRPRLQRIETKIDVQEIQTIEMIFKGPNGELMDFKKPVPLSGESEDESDFEEARIVDYDEEEEETNQD